MNPALINAAASNPALINAAASNQAAAIKLAENRGAQRVVLISVILVLGGVAFGIYKLLQAAGIVKTEAEKLAERWADFLDRWQGFNPNYAKPGQYNLSQSQIFQYADMLSDGMSWWNDDETKLLSALELIGTAKNLSAVAKRYQVIESSSLRQDLNEALNDVDERKKVLAVIKNYSDWDASLKNSNINI